MKKYCLLSLGICSIILLFFSCKIDSEYKEFSKNSQKQSINNENQYIKEEFSSNQNQPIEKIPLTQDQLLSDIIVDKNENKIPEFENSSYINQSSLDYKKPIGISRQGEFNGFHAFSHSKILYDFDDMEFGVKVLTSKKRNGNEQSLKTMIFYVTKSSWTFDENFFRKSDDILKLDKFGPDMGVMLTIREPEIENFKNAMKNGGVFTSSSNLEMYDSDIIVFKETGKDYNRSFIKENKDGRSFFRELEKEEIKEEDYSKIYHNTLTNKANPKEDNYVFISLKIRSGTRDREQKGASFMINIEEMKKRIKEAEESPIEMKEPVNYK